MSLLGTEIMLYIPADLLQHGQNIREYSVETQ